jgi:hypothetical protein
MKDTRAANKKAEEYYRRAEVQSCRICGRLFTRDVRDRVCSRSCPEKAKQEAKQ